MSKGMEEIREQWLDLLTDTLKQLDANVQGAFLQKFLQSLVGREIPGEESISRWEGVLARQSELVKKLGRPVTLGTAAVDYFGDIGILRNPVLLEYGELKRLRYDAATDPLTGLANRRMFEEFLEQEIDRSTRYGSSFALVSFDLRNFKSVNDLCGHAAGDDVLRTVARVTLETIRGSDISCRVGGDEFTILLPRAERAGSTALVERIARKFEEHSRPLAPGVPIGIDYGIAIFPEDGHDAASLVGAADRGLYASKQKAHEQMASRGILPRSGAPLTEALTPKGEIEESRSDAHSPVGQFLSPIMDGVREAGRLVERSAEGRRFERLRLERTPALGVVRVGGKSSTVRVLDASRGGVCILVDQTDLPETFPALLQVPMLPASELLLRRIYSLPLPEGKQRVGCAFSSILDLCSA